MVSLYDEALDGLVLCDTAVKGVQRSKQVRPLPNLVVS